MIFRGSAMKREITKIGKRGTVVIPAVLRRQMHLHEGELMIIESHGDGILLKPAVALPIERYGRERKAEFILSNATDSADYAAARREVEAMGLNPDDISHHKPKE